MFSDITRIWLLWCLARFSLCLRNNILWSQHRYWSWYRSVPSASLFSVRTCVFCSGRSFQSTVRPLVVGTWPPCDEQESQRMQVHRTLVLKMSLPVGFRQCGIWVFNMSTDHCTDLTKTHAQTVDIRLCFFMTVHIGQSPIRCVTQQDFGFQQVF